MAQDRVFVTRQMAQESIDMLRGEGYEVEVWGDELPPPREVLLQKAKESTALLTTVPDKIDDQLLAQAPNLKVVANMAVGFDNLDIASATKRGILMSNTPGVLTKTTADLTFALLLAAARRVGEGERSVRAGKWKTWHPLFFLGQDVYDRTLGIIGMGQIGLEMAKRALGFDMRVLYYDTVRREEPEQRYAVKYCPDIPTVLRQSDFVTLHTNLTPETYHLIGKNELQQMKSTAILVNAARGPIVDPKALYEALRDGVIAGAALDVTEPEPISMDDPLLTLDNVVIVPHIGSASVATRTRMATLAAENIIAALKGEPMPTCLNPEALQKRG